MRPPTSGAAAVRWSASSKYGEDFKHYDYVNPDAPKGGTLNSVAAGTFDSFNPFIVRGSAAAGLNYQGGLLYDTLMTKALDEGSTNHALIADAYKYPDDFSSATYRLDPRAKWHDGTPITVDDVIWSFNFLKANSPNYVRYFGNVTEAVAISDREVEFRFDQKGNRELPHILGDLVVFPKHWWEGTDANGKKRDITQPSLEPPLGSGAYKIESFKPGSEIVWSRVKDYWAADLPVNVGRNNFDRRRYVYIQDDNAAWQAFTKGGFEDIQVENSSRRWSTEYDFPAVKAGDVIKREFKNESGEPMQGFVLNMRRPQFQDRRVRQALTLAYNFEIMNRTLFYRAEHAHGQLFRRAGPGLERPADRQGARAAQRLQGQAAAGIVHAAVQAAGLRFPAGRAPVSQAGRRAVRRGRLEDQRRQDAQRQGRAVQDGDTRQRPDRRSHLHHLYREAAQDRHRRLAAHRRPGAIRQPLPQFRLRLRDGGDWLSHPRPATSSASSGRPRRPTRRARAI